LPTANDVVRLSLSKALIGLDRQEEALAPLNEVLRREPNNGEAHYLRGLVYRGMANYAKAAEDLNLAVQENPHQYESEYNYGFVLMRLGKFSFNSRMCCAG
jgi:tetratricopeptide (TPR) repeat protein